jgi:hypothetical protein
MSYQLAGLKPGTVVRVGRAANFRYLARSVRIRLVRVEREPTSEELVWIDGYVLDETDEAIERRQLIVRLAGLRRDRHRSPT